MPSAKLRAMRPSAKARWVARTASTGTRMLNIWVCGDQTKALVTSLATSSNPVATRMIAAAPVRTGCQRSIARRSAWKLASRMPKLSSR